MNQEDPFFPPQIPAHLRPFIIEQHYDHYTPVDHAVWRYVMRQSIHSLEKTAYGGYTDHFLTTGMSIDALPDVQRMDECLRPYGWGAVAVDGFIPPSVFMDFQAHGILPIAQDIRTLAHINYTPAPDIIHEAAGHAPYITDPVFGKFVRTIGEVGAKAIANGEEYAVYDAIRALSVLKEDPRASVSEVLEAEQELERAIAAAAEPSESAHIARLFWWTVEYGMIGDLDNPKIFGAGLLSSMSEGRDCLKLDVEKIPFSMECAQYIYDITRPQPQLFVIKDFQELFDSLETFAATMAYRVGGTESLLKAMRSRRVCTAVYSSGLQVSGEIHNVERDSNGETIAFMVHGPSSLSVNDQEIEGHGIEAHPRGMVCPVGHIQEFPEGLENASPALLRQRGVVPGARISLHYQSGIVVDGEFEGATTYNGIVLFLELKNGQIRWKDRILDQRFHLVVPLGHSIPSVFAGSADKNRFVVERQMPRVSNARAPVTEQEKHLHALYQQVRDLREATPTDLHTELVRLKHELDMHHPTDWLLRVELLEFWSESGDSTNEREALREYLENLKQVDDQYDDLITRGLKLIDLEEHRAAA